MKRILFVPLLLAILSSSSAVASGPLLTCQILPPAKKECSPHVVITGGDLQLTGLDSFELRARYESCFHVEDVSISGLVQRNSFPGGYTLELLATEIHFELARVTERFPRTIGVVVLKKMMTRGRFLDIWAAQRAAGNEGDGVPAREMHCQTTP